MCCGDGPAAICVLVGISYSATLSSVSFASSFVYDNAISTSVLLIMKKVFALP